MSLTRSQIVSHPSTPEIEYRVTRHQPHIQREGKVVPEGDPYPVLEMYHRDYAGELKRLAHFRMDDFIELNREIVKVGRDLVPSKGSDGDEASLS